MLSREMVNRKLMYLGPPTVITGEGREIIEMKVVCEINVRVDSNNDEEQHNNNVHLLFLTIEARVPRVTFTGLPNTTRQTTTVVSLAFHRLGLC